MFTRIWKYLTSLFNPVVTDDKFVDRMIQQGYQSTKATTQVIPPENKVQKKPVQVEITSKKTLDERLAKIELPVYAQGRKLPPKAKKEFLKSSPPRAANRSFSAPRAEQRRSAVNRNDTTSNDILLPTAAYLAMTDDSSYHSTSSYSSCSSSSSYSSSSSDSGSYDSGSSSSSSCD